MWGLLLLDSVIPVADQNLIIDDGNKISKDGFHFVLRFENSQGCLERTILLKQPTKRDGEQEVRKTFQC